MKVVFTITLACLLLLAAAPSARAGSVLDQSYDPAVNLRVVVGDVNLVDWAQTFTVGVTGTLTEVQVKIYRSAIAPTHPVLFDIRKATGGTPAAADSGSDILATRSIAATSVSTTASFVSIDSLNVAVTGGDVLAIVLRSNAGWADYVWTGNHTATYMGGQAGVRVGLNAWNMSNLTYDLGFKTYVNPSVVPLPAAGWMGLGLLGLLGAFRARRRR